jgi:hypothetical protein
MYASSCPISRLGLHRSMIAASANRGLAAADHAWPPASIPSGQAIDFIGVSSGSAL